MSNDDKALELFGKWKAYELPPRNAEGRFNKDWLNREFISFKAGYQAALASRREQDEWLPIETAPKDGKCVLAWIPQIGLPGVVYCSNGKWHWATSGGWAGFPTHWRPLPSQPASHASDLGREG